MKTIFTFLILLASAINTNAQVTVLKVTDVIERDRIEQWTLKNTFPNLIVFIRDADGNYIVGQEVLSDRAYEKVGLIDGTKEEPLKTYLDAKTDPVIYKPVPEAISADPITIKK